MTLPLSFEVPSALEYFSALVADDTHIPLLEAAVSLGQDEEPGLDVQAVLAEIDGLVERLRRRVPADASAIHRLRHLNGYFFRELGFAGNVNDYGAADNSFLHRVLATRRGIPISLAVLYIEFATQVGLTARGVSFPGHFLVKLRLPSGEAVIDPFTGQSLSRDDLDERLEPYRKQQGLVGDFEVPLGLFLQPASPRDTLARMLNNLKRLHQSAGDWPRLLAVQQRLVRLLPLSWEERRDRGLVLAEIGDAAAAANDLCAYLEHHPDAADATLLQRRVLELRNNPRRLLH